jgi:copper homeostasis protein (lipoprotein)
MGNRWNLLYVAVIVAFSMTACSRGENGDTVSHADGTAPVRLTGMYLYYADASSFEPCGTDKRVPVAMEAQNASLERAYLAMRSEPQQKLLVDVEGHFAMRPPMEGTGEREMLVVTRVIGVFPGETCGNPRSTATLVNTYWKLVRLGNRPVTVNPDQREPRITLRANGQADGSTGCNQFNGRYEVDKERLTFGPMASTRMACPDGMEQEAAFLAALESAVRFKVINEHMELYDAGGEMIARFESRYME